VLVVLCSRAASGRHAFVRAKQAGIKVIAIDAKHLPSSLTPSFFTTKLLAGTVFERHTDTSHKRNVGLLLAHLCGWERIIFLDDDIEVPDPEDLNQAAGMLAAYDGVGLRIGGYPDNSVVCHAYREAGGAQDTFVGGGALAVRTSIVESFFPKVYNEDWFFLLNKVRLRPTAVTGSAFQQPYDPFANDMRARSEEFGDTLAEGVFALLDQGRRVHEADKEYWQHFLGKRRAFIKEVLDMVRDSSHEAKGRMTNSLKAALGRSELIKAEFCEEYLRVWRTDTNSWRRFIKGFAVPKHGTIRSHPKTVLSQLGLSAVSHVHLPAHKKVLVAVGHQLPALVENLDQNVADLATQPDAAVGADLFVEAKDLAVVPSLVTEPAVETLGIGVEQIDGEREASVA
jgi:hypothetical protein